MIIEDMRLLVAQLRRDAAVYKRFGPDDMAQLAERVAFWVEALEHLDPPISIDLCESRLLHIKLRG